MIPTFIFVDQHHNDTHRTLAHAHIRHRFNTIYHGQFCVNETVHVMANPGSYVWDPAHPTAPVSGFCWGCKKGNAGSGSFEM
jgi:hypothetical protein